MPGGDPPGTATAAGGTHPTGMHSCFTYNKTHKIGLSDLFFSTDGLYDSEFITYVGALILNCQHLH